MEIGCHHERKVRWGESGEIQEPGKTRECGTKGDRVRHLFARRAVKNGLQGCDEDHTSGEQHADAASVDKDLPRCSSSG